MARQAIQVGPPNAPDGLEFRVREIQALDVEINALKRETRAVLGLVLVAAGLVASVNQEVSSNIAAIVLPYFLGGLAAYSFNLNADIAATAEQRDRLSNYVNRESGGGIFLTRYVSDHRRGSWGTAITYVLATGIVIASMIVGAVFAWDTSLWFFVLDLILKGISLAALYFAFTDMFKARIDVNAAFDEYLTPIDRPDTAPSELQTLKERIRSALWGRRKAKLPGSVHQDPPDAPAAG